MFAALYKRYQFNLREQQTSCKIFILTHVNCELDKNFCFKIAVKTLFNRPLIHCRDVVSAYYINMNDRSGQVR